MCVLCIISAQNKSLLGRSSNLVPTLIFLIPRGKLLYIYELITVFGIVDMF